MTWTVHLSGVEKRYGPVTALDGVDLSVRAGDLHALAGPNGSGKTTMLRLLAGLARPSAGEVTAPDISVGIAFQQPNVYPDLTVRENVATFADVVGARVAWAERLVEDLRLRRVLHRRASKLSDGFAKKLDIALGMLKEPDVLLLDEPLADLDDLTKARLLDLLAEYAGGDRSVVVSTHNLDSFGPRIDRLTVVYDGAVLRDDEAADLGGAPRDVYLDALDRSNA